MSTCGAGSIAIDTLIILHSTLRKCTFSGHRNVFFYAFVNYCVRLQSVPSTTRINNLGPTVRPIWISARIVRLITSRNSSVGRALD